MLACELEVEKAYVGVMPGIPALLQRLSQTKRLIAVSDTYLPEPLLTELLRQAGLLAYISAVYPSCKYGVNKGSGRLFQKVLELEELEPSELLHIGDNFLGDYYSPRSIGIPSLLVRDRDNLARRAALNAYHSLSGFSPHWHAASFAARLLSEPGVAGPGPYYRWGRATVGPLLVNFVHLLCLELQQSRPDAVFFLAREGFLLKKLYETMSAELFGAPPAEPRYLCVSRYTAFLAALERAGEREVSVALSEFTVGLDAMLTRFGIAGRDQVRHLLERHGWREEQDGSREALRELFLKLLGDPDFLGLALPSSRAMREGLERHLAGLGFFSCARVALADVGWFGGIQDSLAQLFSGGAAPELHGYYLSLEGSPLYGSGQKSGLVHDFRVPSPEGAALGFFKLAFEFSCRALHGTTVGYRELPGGRTVPLFRGDRRERGADAAIAEMQRGVLDCARDYLALQRLEPVHPRELTGPLLSMYQARISFPEAGMVQAFGKVLNTEDFGSTKVKQVADGFRLADLCTPRSTLVRFIETPWREAALCSIPLPGLLSAFAALTRLLAWRKIGRVSGMEGAGLPVRLAPFGRPGDPGAGPAACAAPTPYQTLLFTLAGTLARTRHLMTGWLVLFLRPLPPKAAVSLLETLIKGKRLLRSRRQGGPL